MHVSLPVLRSCATAAVAFAAAACLSDGDSVERCAFSPVPDAPAVPEDEPFPFEHDDAWLFGTSGDICTDLDSGQASGWYSIWFKRPADELAWCVRTYEIASYKDPWDDCFGAPCTWEWALDTRTLPAEEGSSAFCELFNWELGLFDDAGFGWDSARDALTFEVNGRWMLPVESATHEAGRLLSIEEEAEEWHLAWDYPWLTGAHVSQ